MTEYLNKVYEVKKNFDKLVQNTDLEIIKIYEEATMEVSKKMQKYSKTSSTYKFHKQVLRELEKMRYDLKLKLKLVYEQSLNNASSLGEKNTLLALEQVFKGTNLKVEQHLKNKFFAISNETVKQMVAGKYYNDELTLDDRIWQLTKENVKRIDKLIQINIAKGANARELQKVLDRFARPEKRLINHKPLLDKMYKNYSYQARRLARTSLTHAYSESLKRTAAANPFCLGIRWNVSLAHETRQVKRYGPDVCTEYNNKVYEFNKVPIQHPNCMCFFTQEIQDIKKSREELISWIKGEKNPKLDNLIDR